MVVGAENGSNEPQGSTVDSAASSVFETLLSGEPEYRDEASTTPPVQKSPEPAEESDTDEQDEEAPEPPKSEEDESTEKEESDDEQSEPPAGLDPTLKLKVKVDGKDEEVTLDELTKGYSRTADYTRKTQALSERSKALETETVSARQERAQMAEQLKVLSEAIDQVRPREPDWDKLRVEHPAEFARVWAEWQQGEKDRAELKRMNDETQAKVAKDTETVRGERLRAEGEKLLEVFPEWKDAKVGKAKMAEIKAFAEGVGYSEQELQSIDDHRAFVILHKAMMHDKAQAKQAAAVKRIETVRTATPGASSTRAPVSDQTRALQRLAKLRSRDALAGVFETMID